MQNYCKTIGALAAASALMAGIASAEIQYDLHTAYTNQNVFRGQDYGDDLVEVGFDLAYEYNGFGLSAGAWYGSYSQNNPFTGSHQLDELQLYGAVSRDLGFATGSVGYISYQYDKNFFDSNAQEVFFSLSHSFYGFDASLTYFWDVETDNDGYTQLALSKGFELSPCLTLTTGAVVGYLIEEGDFSHLQAKVALNWAFHENATFSPFVAHSWGLGETAGTYQTRYTSRNEVFGGASISVSF